MGDEFEGIQVASAETLAAQFEATVTGSDEPDRSTEIDKARAVAEVQAALTVAYARPRNEQEAITRIKRACQRRKLAEQGIYAYRRGGQNVSGPSIRLAEEIARCWRNLQYGFREVNRVDGFSDVEAFAWDLESNIRVVREFRMRHGRDTKQGVTEVTAERDIYEIVASMAQRRVRACLLEVLPGDIVEMAEEECYRTLAQADDGVPIEQRVEQMIVAFGQYGVSKGMIEEHLGHPAKETVQAELVRLRSIFNSLKNGMARPHDFFKVYPDDPAPPKAKRKATKDREPGDESEDPRPPVAGGNFREGSEQL